MGEKYFRSKDNRVKKFDVLKVKNEQLKALDNSLKFKDEQIKTLENSLKIKDEKAITLGKTIEVLRKKLRNLGENNEILHPPKESTSNSLAYELEDTGEPKEKNFSEKDLLQILSPEEVLVMVREDLRKIFIWKGTDSTVRRKFISANLAQSMLQEFTIDTRDNSWKIVLVDQGDENQEFLDAFSPGSIEVKENLGAVPKVRGINTDLNNKDRIMLLLNSEDLTSSQLAARLGLSKQDTRTYLLRLKKENRIRIVAKKGRFNLYTAKPHVESEKFYKKINALEYDLSYLVNLIEIKMGLKEGKNFTPADTINITRIKDRINETKVDILHGGKENLREEVNKKITNLEVKVNQLTAEEKKKLEKEKLDIFLYNEKFQKYQKYEYVEEGKIYELLNPDFIVLFVDPKRYRIWIWCGSNVSTRMKFIAGKLAPSIRDRYGFGFKITAVDEGNETMDFKLALGINKESDFTDTKKRPKKGPTITINLLIDKAIKKIENIMETESINEIIIQRGYLLEIFDKRILELSNDDGYPMIASWALIYFLQAGIDIKNFGNIIKFYKSGIKFKPEVKNYTKGSNLRVVERMNIQCQFCGYKMVKPFPKDFLCPQCRKYLPDLAIGKMKKVQPKQFEAKTSKLKDKVRVKKKPLDISLGTEKIQLTKGEYVKLLGITSTERTQLYSSNKNLNYLLELTNNLDLIATGVLGGELDKMYLISAEDNTEEKCQFYVKNDIIYLVYGKFPDKKGKWLLEQMSNHFAELTMGKDVNQLNKIQINEIQYKFKERAWFLLNEYLKLQEVFPDKVIPYVEDSIRIDYLGLSSMPIGVISLLLGDELVTEMQMEFENPEEEREMKESMITARIEAIAANTQGNIGAIPRWVAVKVGFQKYRFLSFKKYENDYFLSLLFEGNLEKLERFEKLIDPMISKYTHKPFSGNLKPFSNLGKSLKDNLNKRRKFPPFNFDDKLNEKKKKEVIELEEVKPEARRYCMYCGSKLTRNNDHCSVCGTKIDDMKD